MDKVLLYKLFNEKLDEFTKDLILIAADPVIRNGFIKFRNVVTMVKSMSSSRPQSIFKKHVSPFREQIISGDETFFLHTEELPAPPQQDSQYWIEFIEKIKLVWGDLEEDNKMVVWKYLKVLIALSDKCT